jgi:hypothetical protein
MFFPYFLDATGASSKSRGQHWIPLCALFAILAASDLAFSQEKCVFAISELDFRVRHISTTGVAFLRGNDQVI